VSLESVMNEHLPLALGNQQIEGGEIELLSHSF